MQFGDGSTSRDYTYISDIVDGVIRSLDRPAGYQIYNLGNGNPVRLSTFISLVEKSVGKPVKIRVCPEQPGDVPRTCADVTKARTMLGYNPKVSFAEGIRSTVNWYQERLSSAVTTFSVNGDGSSTADELQKDVDKAILADRVRSRSYANNAHLTNVTVPKTIQSLDSSRLEVMESSTERTRRAFSVSYVC